MKDCFTSVKEIKKNKSNPDPYIQYITIIKNKLVNDIRSLGIAVIFPHMVVARRKGDNLQCQEKYADTSAGC